MNTNNGKNRNSSQQQHAQATTPGHEHFQRVFGSWNAPASRLFVPSTPRRGMAISLMHHTLFLGLGTGGAHSCDGANRRVIAEHGAIPEGAIGFLYCDSTVPDGVDREQLLLLADDGQGNAGAGTDPSRGLVIARRNRTRIEDAIATRFEGFLRGDSLIRPATPVLEAVSVIVVVTPGAMANGLVTEILPLGQEGRDEPSMPHTVARRLGIRNVLLNVVNIGPTIALNALDRNVQPYQRPWLPSNFAQNLQAQFETFGPPEPPTEANERHLHSIALVDQINLSGEAISRMDQFYHRLGTMLFYRFCTDAGSHFEKRRIDSLGSGQVYGQPIGSRISKDLEQQSERHGSRTSTPGLRATRFVHLPRPLTSFGSEELVFNSETFVSQALGRYMSQVVRGLSERSVDADEIQTLLDEAGWSADLLATEQLDQDQLHEQSPFAHAPRRLTARSLQGWLDQVEDLTRDPSAILQRFKFASKRDAGTIAEAVQEVVKAIREREGETVALACLQAISAQARERLAALSDVSMPRMAEVEEIQRHIKEARQKAQVKGALRQQVVRLRPDLPLRSMLSFKKYSSVLKSLEKVSKHTTEMLQAVRDRSAVLAYRALLGTADRQGRLPAIGRGLASSSAKLEHLAHWLERDTRPDHSRRASGLSLIEGLDAPLELGRPRTLWDLYAEAIGTPPEVVTAALWDEPQGLRIDDQFQPPPRWSLFDPAIVVEALRDWCQRRLGALDREAGTGNRAVGEHDTAIDRMKRIGLDHPELRPRLAEQLRQLAKRSAPYVESVDLHKIRPAVETYLFCHPQHRPLLEHLLRHECRLVSAMVDAHGNSPFDLSDPHAVDLVQFAYNVPGQALRAFLAGHHGNRKLAEMGKEGAHCLGGKGHFHFRVLTERPVHHDHDVKELLEALIAAGCVRPRSSDDPRLMFEDIDPSIEQYFFRRKVQPSLMTPNVVHASKDDKWVRRQFIRLFPNIKEWDRLFTDLDQMTDPESVCNRLVAAGVLTAEVGGLFRLAADVEEPRQSILLGRKGFVQFARKEFLGPTPDEFASALIGDDWLYSVCVFALTDAYAEGRIESQQLPEFARRLAEDLNRGL